MATLRFRRGFLWMGFLAVVALPACAGFSRVSGFRYREIYDPDGSCRRMMRTCQVDVDAARNRTG